MADSLTPEQQEIFKQAFSQFDKNGDGKITSSELGQVFKEIGVEYSEEELHKMIEEVDTNKNGSIEFSEFLNMIATKFGSIKN